MVLPIAAAITGISSLLGGLLSKPDKPQYVVPDYAGIRRAAEAAGFNPLTALTQGMQGSVVSGGGGYMGQAIADAGLALADGLAKSKNAGLLSRVQSENAQLREKVQSMTLRPKVGGVYAQRQATPTVPQALGVSGNASARTATSDASATFDLSRVSPLGSPVVGPDDNNLTGPQLAVAKDTAAFRAFGHDFYGSGLFSSAQQVEDAVGESEIISALYAPIAITDALANEAYKAGGWVKEWRNAHSKPAGGIGPVMSMGGQSFMLERPRDRFAYTVGGYHIPDSGPQPRGVPPKKPKYKPRLQMRVPNTPAMRALLRGQ